VGQRSDEIKRHIDEQRSELGENLERLEERVKSTADWRTHFDRRPMMALGVAFGTGLLLSTMLPRGSRGRSSDRYSGYGTTTAAMTGGAYSGATGGTTGTSAESSGRQRKSSAMSRELRKAWGMIDNVRASLIALGASRVKEYLSSAIPGFDEHYRKTEEERTSEKPGEYSGSQGSQYASNPM
jgi:hypothetical protein